MSEKGNGKQMSYLRALFVVGGRIEYFLADLLPYFIGGVLGLWQVKKCHMETMSLKSCLLTWAVGLLVVIMAHYYTVWSNVYADYEMDKQFKSSLSNSVDVVGHGRLLLFTWMAVIVGFLLTAWLCWQRNNYVLMCFWLIGTIFGLVYSLEPIRMKRTVFLGDVGRGVPLIILIPFGYYLFSNQYHNILLFATAGIACNLFGLFMLGETWDWKDDIGHVNTIAVAYGYLAALRIGAVFMPLGAIIWQIGFIVSNPTMIMRRFVLIHFILLLGFMFFFEVRIYRKREQYDEIEHVCGLITKVGTTLFWFSELICAIMLWNMG